MKMRANSIEEGLAIFLRSKNINQSYIGRLGRRLSSGLWGKYY